MLLHSSFFGIFPFHFDHIIRQIMSPKENAMQGMRNKEK